MKTKPPNGKTTAGTYSRKLVISARFEIYITQVICKKRKKYVSFLDTENTQTALIADWQDEKANNQTLISLLCLEVERP